MRIVETVISVNDARKRAMVDKIRDAMGDQLAGRRIAVFGVTFKPNTDDMRDSPSLAIVPALQEAGARIRAFDPQGMTEAAEMMPGIELCGDAYETMEGADALAIVTEWNEFRLLDLERVKGLLSAPLIIDLRNIYKPDEIIKAGFDYFSVGRDPVLAATAQ